MECTYLPNCPKGTDFPWVSVICTWKVQSSVICSESALRWYLPHRDFTFCSGKRFLPCHRLSTPCSSFGLSALFRLFSWLEASSSLRSFSHPRLTPLILPCLSFRSNLPIPTRVSSGGHCTQTEIRGPEVSWYSFKHADPTRADCRLLESWALSR